MLKPTHSRIMSERAKPHLIPLYAVMLLLFFHANITVYVNSSYLTEFISEAAVGVIYMAGAAISVIWFLFISQVLHRVGNYRLTMGLLILDFLAVLCMSFAESARFLIPLFLIHYISLPIIFFNVDVFIEAALDNKEFSTGSNRGLLLTLTGIIGMLAPLVMGISVPASGDFSLVYLLSALTVIPIIILARVNFRDFSDPPYDELDVFSAMGTFWSKMNIRLVFLSTFLLQMFFTFTVIYYPLYLIRDIGLSWEDFGIMMAVAVSAYMIFEYPIGIIADKYIGEKEMMATGFMILALTIASTSFITTTSVLLWSAVMFIMRIGASLVEATTESYFFKKTKSSDAQIISFFRATRPLSYVLTTLLVSLALLFIPFNLVFILTAFAMIPGMFFALNLKDTK